MDETANPALSGEKMGLLFDTTKCIGCGACYDACKESNELPKTADNFLDDHLSDRTFTVVQEHGDRYLRRMCMHCDQPACASACPVGALEKTALGPVIYHQDRCMGCRYCMQACPFSIPKYEWEKALPRVRKCTLCYETRTSKGLPTACAEACPAEATIYGKRDDLIAEAKRRIAESPDTYHNHIYGLEEVGGTSVLLISDVPLEQLGLPAGLGTEPLPELTGVVLEKIPRFSVLAGVTLWGVWWITNRRDEVRQAEGKGAEHARH